MASADGELLATSSGGGRTRGHAAQVFLWRAADGTRLHRLSGLRDGVGGVVFRPDGRQVIAGEARMNAGGHFRALAWDTAHGTLLGSLDGHRGVVTVIVVSRDGAVIATGDLQGVIRIWPADEWCLLHEIPGHDVAVTAIVASSDDRWLATTDDGGGVGTVRILDPGRERW